ncbi:hypothetical protein RYX36_037159 [Vicia faba]
MPPKKDNTFKKQKTFGAGTSRAQESYDKTRFNGPKQQQRFEKLMERRVLDERIFSINPEGGYKSLCDLWREYKWTKLLKPHCNVNTDILREFYANAFPSEGTPFSFSTKVAERTIHFNRDVISEFLGDPLILKEGQLCCYQAAINAKANIQPGMQSNEGQQFMQSNEGQQFMTPDEFATYIAWPGDKPFYQEEGVGPEEEAKDGTSGGSKTALEAGDEMESEFMGGEE